MDAPAGSSKSTKQEDTNKAARLQGALSSLQDLRKELEEIPTINNEMKTYLLDKIKSGPLLPLLVQKPSSNDSDMEDEDDGRPGEGEEDNNELEALRQQAEAEEQELNLARERGDEADETVHVREELDKIYAVQQEEGYAGDDVFITIDGKITSLQAWMNRNEQMRNYIVSVDACRSTTSNLILTYW